MPLWNFKLFIPNWTTHSIAITIIITMVLIKFIVFFLHFILRYIWSDNNMGFNEILMYANLLFDFFNKIKEICGFYYLYLFL